MSAVPELVRRQRATAATLAKYRGRVFDWKHALTCVHMARFHLRAMGHRVPAMPRVRGLIGAKRLLAERGWRDAADMLDAQPALARIAPAEMLGGDIAFRASADGVGCLLVCVGPHKLLGWFDNEETGGAMVVMDMSFDQVGPCWRA